MNGRNRCVEEIEKEPAADELEMNSSAQFVRRRLAAFVIPKDLDRISEKLEGGLTQSYKQLGDKASKLCAADWLYHSFPDASVHNLAKPLTAILSQRAKFAARWQCSLDLLLCVLGLICEVSLNACAEVCHEYWLAHAALRDTVTPEVEVISAYCATHEWRVARFGDRGWYATWRASDVELPPGCGHRECDIEELAVFDDRTGAENHLFHTVCLSVFKARFPEQELTVDACGRHVIVAGSGGARTQHEAVFRFLKRNMPAASSYAPPQDAASRPATARIVAALQGADVDLRGQAPSGDLLMIPCHVNQTGVWLDFDATPVLLSEACEAGTRTDVGHLLQEAIRQMPKATVLPWMQPVESTLWRAELEKHEAKLRAFAGAGDDEIEIRVASGQGMLIQTLKEFARRELGMAFKDRTFADESCITFEKGIYDKFAKRLLGSQSFKSPALLRCALRAEAVSPQENLERQEFLGDAVLDLCTAHDCMLVHCDDRELSECFKQTTKNGGEDQDGLYAIAKALLLGIEHYFDSTLPLEKLKPKTYADIFESVLGALYLDEGLGLAVAHERLRHFASRDGHETNLYKQPYSRCLQRAPCVTREAPLFRAEQLYHGSEHAESPARVGELLLPAKVSTHLQVEAEFPSETEGTVVFGLPGPARAGAPPSRERSPRTPVNHVQAQDTAIAQPSQQPAAGNRPPPRASAAANPVPRAVATREPAAAPAKEPATPREPCSAPDSNKSSSAVVNRPPVAAVADAKALTADAIPKPVKRRIVQPVVQTAAQLYACPNNAPNDPPTQEFHLHVPPQDKKLMDDDLIEKMHTVWKKCAVPALAGLACDIYGLDGHML
ncbi:hypothetical protein DIPPA_00339 [Diplonema papillatum]|nr:hypothetical protein DIPPA_00339 [Diplonema papillatum]